MNEELPGAVLFVCSENAIRSPMAEALFKNIYGNRAYVQSAGVRRGEINPFMREVMGASHNIKNTGKEPMKLYTLYAPPEHIDGTVHATQADAETSKGHFDGMTTE